MSDWQNPIQPINFAGMPLGVAKMKRCAVDPNLMCRGDDCMAWTLVIAGKEPDQSDSQGNCSHILKQSLDMQGKIREQTLAIMQEQFKHEMNMQQVTQMQLPLSGRSN